MKNKGFTLIELLGVITILGIISIVTIPILVKYFKDAQNSIDSGTRKLIYSAATTYLTEYPDAYPKDNGNNYCIYINEDLILNSILDDSNFEKYDFETELDVVEVGVSNNQYSYELVLSEDCVANYESLTMGDGVTLMDDSNWHVLDNVSDNDEYVRIFSDNIVSSVSGNVSYCINIEENSVGSTCSQTVFDTTETSIYDIASTTNIGYLLQNSYRNSIINSITAAGGTPGNLTISLISLADLHKFFPTGIIDNSAMIHTPEWLRTNNYWTNAAFSGTNVLGVATGELVSSVSTTATTYGVRPVITVLKTNIISKQKQG